jgi:uncharacterized membrane protein
VRASALPESLREAESAGVSAELVKVTLEAFAASNQGPLPPVEQTRAYEEVLPGAAERLFRMAELQLEHRHELECMTVKEATNQSWWGAAA